LVKSFNGGKGYGFISYNESDVFVHIRDCEGDGQPATGDTVTFEVEESPSKPGTYKAMKVNGGTAPREMPGQAGMKGGGKGGGKPPAQGTGAYHGMVKSYNPTKAWGFIVYEGTDVFFHVKDFVDGSAPNAGDAVQFDLEENPGKPGSMKATNATGGTGYPTPKGMEKGMDKGGYGMSPYDSGKGKGGGWGGPPMDPWGGCGGGGGYGMGPYDGGKGKGGGWGGPPMDPWGGKGGDPWGMGGGGGGWGGKGGDPWGGKGGMMMGGKGW